MRTRVGGWWWCLALGVAGLGTYAALTLLDSKGGIVVRGERQPSGKRTISGAVVDSAGRGLSGATVRVALNAVDRLAAFEAPLARSNEKGEFELVVPFGWMVGIWATHETEDGLLVAPIREVLGDTVRLRAELRRPVFVEFVGKFARPVMSIVAVWEHNGLVYSEELSYSGGGEVEVPVFPVGRFRLSCRDASGCTVFTSWVMLDAISESGSQRVELSVGEPASFVLAFVDDKGRPAEGIRVCSLSRRELFGVTDERGLVVLCHPYRGNGGLLRFLARGDLFEEQVVQVRIGGDLVLPGVHVLESVEDGAALFDRGRAQAIVEMRSGASLRGKLSWGADPIVGANVECRVIGSSAVGDEHRTYRCVSDAGGWYKFTGMESGGRFRVVVVTPVDSKGICEGPCVSWIASGILGSGREQVHNSDLERLGTVMAVVSVPSSVRGEPSLGIFSVGDPKKVRGLGVRFDMVQGVGCIRHPGGVVNCSVWCAGLAGEGRVEASRDGVRRIQIAMRSVPSWRLLVKDGKGRPRSGVYLDAGRAVGLRTWLKRIGGWPRTDAKGCVTLPASKGGAEVKFSSQGWSSSVWVVESGEIEIEPLRNEK